MHVQMHLHVMLLLNLHVNGLLLRLRVLALLLMLLLLVVVVKLKLLLLVNLLQLLLPPRPRRCLLPGLLPRLRLLHSQRLLPQVDLLPRLGLRVSMQLLRVRASNGKVRAVVGHLMRPRQLLGRLQRKTVHRLGRRRLLHHLLWLMRHRRFPALIGDVAKGVPARERLHLFAALLLQLLLLLAQLGRVGPIIGDEELLLKCIGVNDEHPDVRPHTRPRDATQTSSNSFSQPEDLARSKRHKMN